MPRPARREEARDDSGQLAAARERDPVRRRRALVRRNAIIIFMSVELMLNAGNLALIGFARNMNSLDGQMIVFFVMAVAAAEVRSASRSS